MSPTLLWKGNKLCGKSQRCLCMGPWVRLRCRWPWRDCDMLGTATLWASFLWHIKFKLHASPSFLFISEWSFLPWVLLSIPIWQFSSESQWYYRLDWHLVCLPALSPECCCEPGSRQAQATKLDETKPICLLGKPLESSLSLCILDLYSGHWFLWAHKRSGAGLRAS